MQKVNFQNCVLIVMSFLVNEKELQRLGLSFEIRGLQECMWAFFWGKIRLFTPRSIVAIGFGRTNSGPKPMATMRRGPSSDLLSWRRGSIDRNEAKSSQILEYQGHLSGNRRILPTWIPEAPKLFETENAKDHLKPI
ncbi:MAG: hypothetical protein HQL31_09505 [Planctomycetes bacterium]|nr:hypothetical protein [Planctomycetota bacterium]